MATLLLGGGFSFGASKNRDTSDEASPVSTRQSQGMYIGETEKNLVRLVDVSDAFDSMLFFDEADDLFGRRADGDRSS